ncbi:translation initiation factor IF-2 [Candidatus Dojkabacteria bacterium]|uniref:Translation initiation factor IF-2 n=1 Tax=Candidatus Dojkabacteria bacterium TaxID=2099670 RepID=A0A955L352_9BACT|nr:translation initiation factor IF-2 [Candidatus Dojkabacteria bacterium]
MNKKTKQKKKAESNIIPVITVMGHVDHGKTSLLDQIKSTRIQQSESGGITQSIRAHEVEYKGKKLTFIDTPGHEAFSILREKGASVTNIVLLVVAADDGVKPQTLESISYAKKYKIPMVVAINKIDLPTANVKKVKQELASADVLLEDWGGDVLFTEVSAKENKNIDKLLENIFLQAELSEIKEDKKKLEGADSYCVVLESYLDRSMGTTSLIIVKAGKLKLGDTLCYGEEVSRIKSIQDEFHNELEEAVAGESALITGIKNLLDLGKPIYSFDSHEKAVEFINKHKSTENIVEEIENVDTEVSELSEEEQNQAELEMLLTQFESTERPEEGAKKTLPVILKTDTLGSVNAIISELEKLSDDETDIKIIRAESGEITKNDIQDAKTSKAIILGFNAVISPFLQTLARRERVIVKNYQIIYELLDEVDAVLELLATPDQEEIITGKAKIKKKFVLSNGDIIAGCMVEDGSIKKGHLIYAERKGERIGEGKISSLKREKDEIKEAVKGTECGILITPVIEISEGDTLYCYRIQKN